MRVQRRPFLAVVVSCAVAGAAAAAQAQTNGQPEHFTAMFQDYVRNELKWESDLHYPTAGNVRPWNWDEFQNEYMDMR